MNTLSRLGLCLLLGLSLTACKKAPVSEDPQQQEQAIVVMKKQVQAFFINRNQTTIQNLTAMPFVVDGDIFTSLNALNQKWDRSEFGQTKGLNLEILETQFITLDRLKQQNVKAWEKLQKILEEGSFPTPLYLIKTKVRFQSGDMIDEDEGYMLMHQNSQGFWQVHGYY